MTTGITTPLTRLLSRRTARSWVGVVIALLTSCALATVFYLVAFGATAV